MHVHNTSQQPVSSIVSLPQLDQVFEKMEKQNVQYGQQFDLPLLASFMQDYLGITENRIHPVRLLPSGGLKNPSLWQRFIAILRRAAKAHEGVSRQERIFIEQYWLAMKANSQSLYVN